MAGTGQYTTLAAVKARLDRSDAKDDATLTAIIMAASRHIDGQCNRSFGQVSETRVLQAMTPMELITPDLVSISALRTDDNADRVYETSWATTDYDLEPGDGTFDEWPYTAIVVTPLGARAFPTHRRGVQITGVWGWPAVPAAVEEATVLMTIRLFQRRNAPYGIAGANDLGQAVMIGRTDPDVAALLAPYRRFALGAV